MDTNRDNSRTRFPIRYRSRQNLLHSYQSSKTQTNLQISRSQATSSSRFQRLKEWDHQGRSDSMLISIRRWAQFQAGKLMSSRFSMGLRLLSEHSWLRLVSICNRNFERGRMNSSQRRAIRRDSGLTRTCWGTKLRTCQWRTRYPTAGIQLVKATESTKGNS